MARCHIATVTALTDVVGSASKRMLSLDLASILIITFVIFFDIWLCNQWLATSTQALLASSDLHDFDAEEPEPTRGDFVPSQTFLGFQLLVDIFDTSLFAVVIVI